MDYTLFATLNVGDHRRGAHWRTINYTGRLCNRVSAYRDDATVASRCIVRRNWRELRALCQELTVDTEQAFTPHRRDEEGAVFFAAGIAAVYTRVTFNTACASRTRINRLLISRHEGTWPSTDKIACLMKQFEGRFAKRGRVTRLYPWFPELTRIRILNQFDTYGEKIYDKLAGI